MRPYPLLYFLADPAVPAAGRGKISLLRVLCTLPGLAKAALPRHADDAAPTAQLLELQPGARFREARPAIATPGRCDAIPARSHERLRSREARDRPSPPWPHL